MAVIDPLSFGYFMVVGETIHPFNSHPLRLTSLVMGLQHEHIQCVPPSFWGCDSLWFGDGIALWLILGYLIYPVTNGLEDVRGLLAFLHFEKPSNHFFGTSWHFRDLQGVLPFAAVVGSSGPPGTCLPPNKTPKWVSALQIQCTNYHKFGNHLHGLNQSKSQIPRQITGTLPNSYTYKLLYTRATSLRRHWKLCLVEELTPKGFISGWWVTIVLHIHVLQQVASWGTSTCFSHMPSGHGCVSQWHIAMLRGASDIFSCDMEPGYIYIYICSWFPDKILRL